MLLAKLKEHYEQRAGEELPPHYANTPVAWIVAINADGVPRSKQPISRIDPSTARGKRGLDMLAPEVMRANKIRPLLLADNGEYTFGRARNPKKQARAEQCHTAHLDLIRKCADATREPSVQAVLRFYDKGGAELLDLGDDWDYGLKVTFQVHFESGNCRPIDLQSVQRFWAETNATDPAETGQCLVCGEFKPVLGRLQSKIKGIPGGQPSGTSIISANDDAFESYGLEASKIAPTCAGCGEAFTRAANTLLSGDNSNLRIGDTKFIFWTRQQESGFDLAGFLNKPDSAEVKALLGSADRGRHSAVSDPTAFYAAALTASGGRTVVRDWIDTTVANAAEGLARWFTLQRIADPRDDDPIGENPRPLSLFQLAVSTVRDSRDLPPNTPRALFRTALSGAPLPFDLAFQAVRRCRADQSVTRPRAALIKLVLLSRDANPSQEDYMVALAPEHPEAAYHCGRLLAVLENTQRAAIPNANATIVDRYYGAASSTPATVFGVLLRGAQPHLSKLDGPAQGALQNRIASICGQIDGFPKTLTLEQQALFSLGYYHQRAHDRAQAISRRAEKDGKKAAQTPTKLEDQQ